jgi:hypothetical protein
LSSGYIKSGKSLEGENFVSPFAALSAQPFTYQFENNRVSFEEGLLLFNKLSVLAWWGVCL